MILDVQAETGRTDFLDALKPRPRDQEASWPKGNAIKRGELAEFPRVAEDAAALIGRAQECFHAFRPGDGFQGWAIDQIAATTLRLDRLGRADRRIRDRVVIRAESCWDDDKMMDAEVSGARLASAPAIVVAQLRSTPHGCDWLIRRWAGLAVAAKGDEGWTPAHLALAFDLLKTPADARQGEPGRVIRLDDDGAVVVANPDRSELARGAIAELRRRKAEVLPLDAIDRAMTEADFAIEPTPEMRDLGRHESKLRSWLRWLVGQVRMNPPDRNSRADLKPELPPVELATEVLPRPQEAANGLSAEVEPKGAAGAEAEVAASPRLANLPRPERGARKEAIDKAEARREAKRRKAGRRRA